MMRYTVYTTEGDESTEQEVTKEVFNLISRLDDKLDLLEKCAEFYADKMNWRKDSQDFGSSMSTMWQITGKDLYEQNEAVQYGGRLAKETIKTLQEE